MTQFDFSWSLADTARTLEFQARLNRDHKEFFCSDDFRIYNLHRFMDHPERQIGAYFAKLKFHKYAEPLGEIPSEIESNNRRKVDLWRFLPKATSLGKGTLDKFGEK